MRLAFALRGLLLVALLGLMACEEYIPPPPPPPSYYVIPAKTFLRDCPGDDCGIIAELYNGDRVEQLEVNDFGWWRVQSDRTGQIGWMPGAELALSPLPPSPPRPLTYFVSISSLNLRQGPTTSSRIVSVLYLNEEVEKIDESPYGWFKVRRLRDGATGWVASRYLETHPVSRARKVYRKRRGGKKAVTPEKKEPEPTPAKARPM